MQHMQNVQQTINCHPRVTNNKTMTKKEGRKTSADWRIANIKTIMTKYHTE